MKGGRKRKGKDNLQKKKDKSEGKKDFKAANSNPNKKNDACPSCGAKDHFSSRSPSCPNHKETLQDKATRIAGTKREHFCRRVPFSSIARPEYHDELRQRICELSTHLREIIIRVQLFVNDFIIFYATEPIDKYVFNANFFYSTAQLVMGKSITNDNPNYPQSVLSHWAYFKDRYECTYTMPMTGYSAALSYACKLLETTYINFYVENFHEFCPLSVEPSYGKYH